MIIDNASHYKEQVIALLISEKLPVADLPESLENFLVAIQDKEIVGVAGVQVYGDYGLFRSLAVYPEHRGSGIAGKLVTRIEALSGYTNDIDPSSPI
ncbi:GNAT family N-acetyltransferase [Mucilaginibacter terrae]|uniref:GNAT family N-acetyltransferase n=1 Tax=Mucilaginibacter terrae TaxID=1955052 RepID=UPI00362FD200